MECLSKHLLSLSVPPQNPTTHRQMASIKSFLNPFRINNFPSKSLYSSLKLVGMRQPHCGYSSDTIRGVQGVSAMAQTFDVVVVGAGIIGITIARQFLLHSVLSVAIVDAAVPCAGATGAGQGYIWMVHKSPDNPKWELALRGRQLWENLAEEIQNQGMDPLDTLGWKKTGSMLIGRTTEECDMLKKRVQELSEAGLQAEFLSAQDVMAEEPALRVGEEGGAAFLLDDCQMDAKRSVAYLEKINRHFSSEGRYAEFYHEPATGLLRSGNGEVTGVQTCKSALYGKKAVIIAAGCWSGSLMHDLLKDSDIELEVPVKPRKGHLLVLENFNTFKLNHGLMEAGYVNHQAATLNSTNSGSVAVNAHDTSVSMAATMDQFGNLVLGSSRQLVGFNTEIDETIINSIWERAAEFLPALRGLSLKSLLTSREVRVGLRPYMPDGKPLIGPVPSLPNLFLAAGHEGEGLTLSLATAEMVADMVLGNPGKVDVAPYAVQNRCS